MAGRLVIRPLGAKLTHDTDFFTKMDPYCVVRLGHSSQKTAVAKSAGKLPVWRDELVFREITVSEVVFEVWDRDTATADDLVGEARLDLRKLPSEIQEGWLKLNYRGRSAGKLHVSIEFTSERRAVKSEPNLQAVRLNRSPEVEEKKTSSKAGTHKPQVHANSLPTSSDPLQIPRIEGKMREVATQSSEDNSNYPAYSTCPQMRIYDPNFRLGKPDNST